MKTILLLTLLATLGGNTTAVIPAAPAPIMPATAAIHAINETAVITGFTFPTFATVVSYSTDFFLENPLVLTLIALAIGVPLAVWALRKLRRIGPR